MTRNEDSSTTERSTHLIVATAAHFDWAMLGPEAPPANGLRLSEGGLEAPGVLAWIQRASVAVSHAIGRAAAWLIVEGDEAVGIISFKGVQPDGAVEIGYGIAESHRNRGHASRAVALLVRESDGLHLVAETSVDNRASQVVLERNGFRRCGERIDPEDGALLSWRLE